MYFRLIFWTVRGITPRIEVSDLDGSNRHTLIDKDILFPTSLVMDHMNHRLFWLDIKLYRIETMHLDSGDRTRIHPFNEGLSNLNVQLVNISEMFV